MTSAQPPTPEPSTPPPFQQPNGEQPAPPPVPAVQQGRSQLRRSASNRMIGGVCGGLAEYSGVDALIWRAGFAVFTLAGGSGILLYLLLWVLMPPAPLGPNDRSAPLEQQVQRLHAKIQGARTPPAGT